MVRTLRRIDMERLAFGTRDLARAVKFTVFPESPDTYAQLSVGWLNPPQT
jgi:hypothetical protein